MNNIVTKVKNTVIKIEFKQCIPVMLLAGFFLMIPETGHALTIPFNKYLEEFTSEIITTVRYLAVLGIIITAVGWFLGNDNSGMRKMLQIMMGICIAAYASTIVAELMGL